MLNEHFIPGWTVSNERRGLSPAFLVKLSLPNIFRISQTKKANVKRGLLELSKISVISTETKVKDKIHPDMTLTELTSARLVQN